MKRFAKLLSAVVALAAVSCTTDTTEDLVSIDFGQQSHNALRVTLADPTMRTSFGEATELSKYPVVWSEGDTIDINGESSEAAEIDEENPSQAVFRINSADITLPYHIVYPANDLSASEEAGKYPVYFAPAQHYVEGTFSPNSAPMCGTASGFEDTTLRHLSAVVRFAVKMPQGKEDLGLKYIALSTTDMAPISGAFDVDCATGVITPRVGAQKVISYLLPSGFMLGQQASEFFIAIPAGEYEGFKATVVAADGGSMELSFSANGEKQLKAGVVREFEEVEFVPSSEVYLIGTAEELIEFGTKVNNKQFKHEVAVITNDIDMTGVNWTPIKSFSKTLNGNEYVIKGLNMPLFEKVSGTLINLHVEANIVDGSNSYLGIIARNIDENGQAINCISSGSVTYSNSKYVSTLRVGGMFGGYYNALLSGCTNNARVIIGVAPYDATKPVTANIGGLVGYTDVWDPELDSQVYDCVNNGAIVWADNSGIVNFKLNAGGILSYNYTKVIGCKNYGVLDFETPFSGDLVYGGIVCTMSSGGLVENCENRARCVIDADAVLGKVLQVGGLVGSANAGAEIYSSSNYGLFEFNGTLDARDNTMNSTFYVGGLIGTLASPIEGCNSYGDIVINGRIRGLRATNHIAIGGITGCAKANITNCLNSGRIITAYKVDLNDVDQDGSGTSCIGGLVGLLDNGALTNSTNTGEVSCAIETRGALYLGGVLGRSEAGSGKKISLSGCTNGQPGMKNGKVTFTGNLSGLNFPNDNTVVSMGGVVGGYMHVESAPTGCKNYGDVKFAGVVAAQNDYSLDLGGVVGFAASSASVQIADHENYGDVTCEADLTDRLFMGGALGRNSTAGQEVTNLYNAGNVTFKGSAIGDCGLGGCMGFSYNTTFGSSLSKFTNEGSVTFEGTVNTGQMDMGGCVGFCYGIKESTNSGSIYSKALSVGDNNGNSVGGVAGRTWHHIQDSSNSGDITYDVVEVPEDADHLTKPMAVGGVVAYAATDSAEAWEIKFTGLTNSGNITVNGGPRTVKPLTHDALANIYNYNSRGDYSFQNRVCIAGVIGRIRHVNNCKNMTTLVEECHNTGNIHMPNALYACYNSVAGVAGDISVTKLTFQNNTNGVRNDKSKGNITVEGPSGENNQLLHMAGLLGFVYQQTATLADYDILDCVNYGNIHLSDNSCMEHPHAAGILGNVVSTLGGTDYQTNMLIERCKNYGNISRRSRSHQATQSFAGGIVAIVGALNTSYESLSATDFECRECENYGDIQFDPSTENGPVEYGVGDYAAGGIIGYTHGGVEPNRDAGAQLASDFHMPAVVSCRNYGNIYGWCGCIGGIVGYQRSYGKVLGTADSYCINEGSVGVRYDSQGNVITSPNYYLVSYEGTLVSSYVGGIVGYSYEGSAAPTADIPGTAHNECWVKYAINRGVVGGVTNTGGITGRGTSGLRSGRQTQYCMSSGTIYGFGGKAGAISGEIPTADTYGDMRGIATDCAAGGRIVRGETGNDVMPDNFFNFIYGQNASNSGQNEYWDGVSPTSWQGGTPDNGENPETPEE